MFSDFKMITETQQIKLKDICLDVIRKDIKNIYLSVYPPTGRIRISVPLRMSLDTLRVFVISKLAWIRKQQSKYLKQARETPRKYLNRESHYFEGVRYSLNVIYHNAPRKVEIRNQTYIDLYVRKGSNLDCRRKVMIEWYRQQLKDRIPVLISKWQKTLGLELKTWGVKRMKTRWGTCNVKAKRIWLNLELAKKPGHCLEYIIVHEILHLLERKHNGRYRAYMDKFMPQWRSYKEELNRPIRA